MNGMKKEEFEQIKKIVVSKSDIYFDCFDTLISRKYSTRYVFWKIADFMIEEYAITMPLNNLYRSIQSFFVQCDIPFEKIVWNIYLHYIDCTGNGFEIFLNNFKTVYVNAEMENAVATPYCEELLDFLKYNKKKIYILSDYYLGKEFLTSLIQRVYGKSIFDDLFISCDFGKTKQDGSLYECVINPATSLMIGDHIKNDIRMSQKWNIAAFHLDARKQYEKYNAYNHHYSKQIYSSLLRMTDKNGSHFCVNYAFDLFAFCKILYSRLYENDIVFFLARDGQFMKECFDYYLRQSNRKNIKTKYLEVSRLALLLPCWDFENKSYQEFESAFSSRTGWKVSTSTQLLSILGFESDEISSILGELHLSPDEEIVNYFKSDIFCTLYESEVFQRCVKEKQKNAREKFSRLTQTDNRSNRFITVDMGWKGTSQNDMRMLLPEDTQLIGYYFGTTECIGEMQDSYREGLMFDYKNELDPVDTAYREIEALLKTDKGQLVCYKQGSDVYVDDNGVKVYHEFAEQRQKEAWYIFKNIIELDTREPVSIEILRDTIKKLRNGQSLFSIAWGRYYFFIQGNDDIRKKPNLSDFKYALKIYCCRHFPGLFHYIRRKQNL